MNEEEYNKMIEEIILFLSGKEEKLIEILKKFTTYQYSTINENKMHSIDTLPFPQ